jgi:hypothetical protein
MRAGWQKKHRAQTVGFWEHVHSNARHINLYEARIKSQGSALRGAMCKTPKEVVCRAFLLALRPGAKDDVQRSSQGLLGSL